LTEESPESNGVANPRMPFAVSGEGAAAFAYDDGFGMYVWVCNSRCAARNSWARVTLADVYSYAEAVAFGSGQSLQVIGRQAVRNSTNETMVWFDCPGHCTAGSRWVDHPQQCLAALREPERLLASILDLRAALDEASPNEPVDEARRGRRRAAERVGEVRHGRYAAVGEDVERGELREAEPEAAELRREPDDELPPQRTAHRDAFRELAGIRGPEARVDHGSREVGLEHARDRP